MKKQFELMALIRLSLLTGVLISCNGPTQDPEDNPDFEKVDTLEAPPVIDTTRLKSDSARITALQTYLESKTPKHAKD